MKYIIVFALLALGACRSDPIAPGTDGTECDSLEWNGFGDLRVPATLDDAAVSSDGAFICIAMGSSTLQIVERATGAVSNVVVNEILPDSLSLIGISSVQYCPYSNDLVLVRVSARARNERGNRYIAIRPMIIDLRERRIAATFPIILGHFDANRGYSAHWLPESRPGDDQFRLSGSTEISKYLLQSGSLIPYPGGDWWARNLDGTILLYLDCNQLRQNCAMVVNGDTIYRLSESIQAFDWDFSPSGRYFALTMSQNADPFNVHLVIIDRQFGRALDIGLLEDFCFYAVHGAKLAFIDESNLIVSVHRARDDYQRYQQFSITGALIGPIGVVP